jgi:hypothetical protein
MDSSRHNVAVLSPEFHRGDIAAGSFLTVLAQQLHFFRRFALLPPGEMRPANREQCLDRLLE